MTMDTGPSPARRPQQRQSNAQYSSSIPVASSRTQTPQPNLYIRNLCTTQDPFNYISPVDQELTEFIKMKIKKELTDIKSASSFVEPNIDPEGDNTPVVKRRCLMRNTHPILSNKKVSTGETKADTNTPATVASPGSTSGGAGTSGSTNHPIKSMPQQTLQLRSLLLRDGSDASASGMKLQSNRSAKRARQRSNTWNIPTTPALHPDPGHYYSDSEDTVPLELSTRVFFRLVREMREYELEREREGGYEADVEDEGEGYETECFYDSRAVLRRLGSNQEDAKECNEDVSMYME